MSFHKQKIEIARRTHEIFCGISGKDIVLVTVDHPARTDVETFIGLPLEDPDVDLLLKHEWQHIFFKTDLHARAAFVSSYAQGVFGTHRNLKFESYMHHLLNALDDVRVNSLWAIIYPNSAEMLAFRWKRIITQTGYYRRDLLQYVLAHGMGLQPAEITGSAWAAFDSIILEAISMVYRAGFPSTLLAGRRILDSMLSWVQKAFVQAPAPTPAPAPATTMKGKLGQTRIARRPTMSDNAMRNAGDLQVAQHRVIQSMLDGSSRPVQRGGDRYSTMDTPETPSGLDPDWRRTKELVDTVLGASNDHQMQALLAQSQFEMNSILESLKSRTRLLPMERKLLLGLEGGVIVRRLKKKDLNPFELGPEDSRLIETMRHMFYKLLDRKSRKRSSSGQELDVQAYIDFTMGNGDPDIFIEDTSSRGFKALVLLDMSSSMKNKWQTVCRACKVLAKSLKFPFVELSIMGFSTNRAGETVLFDFEDPEWGYAGSGISEEESWGLTPLHIAIEVAYRHLKMGSGAMPHLFVLSDGYPELVNSKTGYMPSTEELVAQVHRTTKEAKTNCVSVLSLLIGDRVDDEGANLMFGRHNWSRVSEQEDDIFRAMVLLVKKAFLHYLGVK